MENKTEEKYDANKSGNKSSGTDSFKDVDNLQDVKDIEYTNTKLDELKDKQVFNPVTKPWQLRQNKILNLKIEKSLIYKYRGKILGEPTKIVNIIGDGNCLYRSLSYWINGTEDHHLKIRNLIAEVVKSNENIEKYVGGKNKLLQYLEKNIENDGVWGTDVEIFAAAFLIQTSIYVYSTVTNKWQIFNKYMDLKKKVMTNEKCIYLRNINNVHYDVVMDV
ncbi:unnamed protein product [Macrosiphum euphorbiae]|uniref:OTU domain-containing protein n=1 Tax=Macrosiphum euphorbiae TaxID=13131 RepID=A0AAV0VXC6_9HEMI|nr:unnamed protein product [Macrosiphum euphorbiae]